ncbi:MAG: hypothetical protein ACRET5_15820 [Steroidobacteraceae bacterium]
MAFSEIRELHHAAPTGVSAATTLAQSRGVDWNRAKLRWVHH